MATADSVKTKIQGLIDTANATTGGNAKTLTSAVNTLINGYGKGSGIYIAKVTPEEDKAYLYVHHNLGTKDILLAVCWAETLGDIVPTFGGTLGKYWAKTDIPPNYASSDDTGNFNAYSYYSVNYGTSFGDMIRSSVYWDGVGGENLFVFAYGYYSSKFIAGVTYTVIIIAADAEV